MNSTRFILLMLISVCTQTHAADFIKKISGFGAPAAEQEVIFGSSPVSEKAQMLRVYNDRLAKWQREEAEITAKYKKQLDALSAEIKSVKEKISATIANPSSFLDEKLGLLNERYQAIVDIQQVRVKIADVLKQIISVLEDYVKNPTFDGVRVQPQSGYRWNVFLELSKQVLSLEEGLQKTRAENKTLQEELEDLQKDALDLEKKIKEKEKEQKEFGTGTAEKSEKLTTQEQAELLDLRKNLLETKKELIGYKIALITRKQDYANLRVFVAESQLELFRADVEDVSQKLIIDEAVIQQAESALADKKRTASERQEQYSQELAKLNAQRDQLKKSYDEQVKAHGAELPDKQLIDEWSFDVKIPTFNPLIFKIALTNSQVLDVERDISIVDAQRELERMQVRSQELLVQVFNTWYKILERRVGTEDLRAKDLKEFEAKKVELKRELAAIKDKTTALNAQVNSDTRALTNVGEKANELKQHEAEVVRRIKRDAYNKSLDATVQATKVINDLIAKNGNLTKVYAAMTGLLNEDLKQIDLVLGKLERIGSIWQRSAQAISFENIMKVILPDFKEFLVDLKNIFYRMNFASFMFTINLLAQYPAILLRLLMMILLLFAVFFILYFYLPRLKRLLQVSQEPLTPRGAFRNLLAEIVGFVRSHLFGIWLWIFLFAVLKMNVGIALGFNFTVIFYLLSIPYLCYLSYMFIRLCARFNEQHDYIFVSEIFQRRLQWVLFLFAAATITVFFFREAFMMVTFGKTEVPTFLMRVYSVIARILLICLLIKEEVISLIPTRSKFWLWLRGVVDTYYYVFLFILLGLFLLWDPHIGGYNRLVYYIVSSSLGTVVLLALLWGAQSLLKRFSAYFFFAHERGEKAQERFSNAATWYGVFIVASLTGLAVAGIYFGAKIWGHPLALDKIIDGINFTIMRIKEYDETNQQVGFVYINIGTLIKIALYVIGGMIAARIFERFVIKRIFNLLLVDSAVQNTVLRLSFISFVIISFLVGLSRVGFSQDHIYAVVLALLFGVVFGLRNIAADLFAYFTILLERSVKIGDYIRLGEKDKELSGVVRKITPRTIVLRKKNSMNIVIPNSEVANTSIFNWNYTRGFFAFDDIQITVMYKADPQRVKDILMEVLEEDRNVLKSPHPVVRFEHFTQDGMQYIVRGFLSTINVLNQWEIASDIRIKLVQALRANGINIAYPVRIIRMANRTNKNQLPMVEPDDTPLLPGGSS